jgi:hypothetical protein
LDGEQTLFSSLNASKILVLSAVGLTMGKVNKTADSKMPRLSDDVVDSKLSTEFRDSATIHSFLDIDNIGGRSTREERWEIKRFLGKGGFGQVRLERCVTSGAKLGALRAVKIIDTQSNLYKALDFNRELEAIAKFSKDRVSNTRI